MAPRLEVEPELAAERHVVRRRRKPVFSTILALLMMVFAGGLWMGYHLLSRRAGEVPLIRADDQPIKTAPEKPGGMQVPGQNMYILNKEGQNDTHVEQLLPPPEAPLPRPTPQNAAAGATPTAVTAPSATAQPNAPAPAQASAQPNPAPPAPANLPPPAQPNGPANAPVTAAAPPAVVVPPHPVVPPTPTPPPAQTAVAVPPHPVAPPLPAPAPRPPPVHAAPAHPEVARLPPSKAGGGDYRIQVGAVRSVAAAQEEWNRLKRAQPDLLGSLHADAVRLDLGDRGIFYRIQVGPVADAAAGDRLCRELKRRNVGCLLVRK